jgi:hypothetical protein
MSRMWTIFRGTGPGGFLMNCRILVTPGAGNSTYQFLPPAGGGGELGSSSTPSFLIVLNGQAFNVNAGPPPTSGYWFGTCFRRSEREAEDGEWQAEARGGESVKGKGHPSKKRSAKKSSAKSPRKSSAKKSSRKTSAKKSPRKSSAKKSSAKSTRKRSS